MNKISHPYSIFVLSAAAALSLAAGFTNGLLGAGSGIIFMIVSRLVTKNRDGKEMYSFAIMCVIPVSVISLLMYPRELFPPADLITIIPLAIVGGYLGAIIKDRINAAYLGLAFAAITVYSGISMIVRAL